jgi:AbrB family looped-hinge helix DNA binding protein
MGSAAKVTSKGQITIPNSVREEFGIEKGDDVVFYKGLDGRMRVRVRKLRKGAGGGSVHWPEAPRGAEAVREAARTAVISKRTKTG